MKENWEVELRINGENVLTIGSTGYVAGIPEIDEKANIVRSAAEHLNAFIGPKRTESDLAAKQVELLRGLQDAVLFGLDMKEPLSCMLDIIQDKINKLEGK